MATVPMTMMPTAMAPSVATHKQLETDVFDAVDYNRRRRAVFARYTYRRFVDLKI
jgi:hypothetical protein